MIGLVYGYYVRHGGIGRFIAETLKRVRNPRLFNLITMRKTLPVPKEVTVSMIECERDIAFLSAREILAFSLQANRTIVENSIRLVHSHGVYELHPDFYTAHICLDAYANAVREIFGASAAAPDRAVVEIEQRFFDSLRENCILPVSYKVAQEIARRNNFDLRKFTVCHGAPRFRARMAVRRRNGGPLRIGTVATTMLGKGVPFFCEVAKILLKRGLDLEFLVAGCDRDTAQYVTKRISGNVSIKTKVSLGEDFFSDLDSFLSLSVYEGYSLVTLEAMAMGVPVVSSTRNGVFFDAEQENPDLQLAKVDDITDTVGIADVTEQLLTDPSFRIRTIQAGFDLVQPLDWNRVAAVYETAYASRNPTLYQ